MNTNIKNQESEFVTIDNSAKKDKMAKNKENKKAYEKFCSEVWPTQRQEFLTKSKSVYMYYQKQTSDETLEQYTARVEKAVESARRKNLDCGRSNSDCSSRCLYTSKCDANRRYAFDQYQQHNSQKVDLQIFEADIKTYDQEFPTLVENSSHHSSSTDPDMPALVSADTLQPVKVVLAPKIQTKSGFAGLEIEDVESKISPPSTPTKQQTSSTVCPPAPKKKEKTEKQIREEQELADMEAFINSSSKAGKKSKK